jgi:hypothetical protein
MNMGQFIHLGMYLLNQSLHNAIIEDDSVMRKLTRMEVSVVLISREFIKEASLWSSDWR